MNVLVEEPIKFSKFNKLVKDVELDSGNLSILGLTDSQKAHMIYSIYNYSKKSPVIVCPNVSIAKKMIQDLKFYSNTEIVYLPAREVMYYDSDIESREIENARVYAINKIIEDKPCIIVTVVEALMQNMLPKSVYENKNIYFKTDLEISLDNVVTNLSELGYSKHDIVEGKGQFAVRGGIIDIFPINTEIPYRIELFGDEIDSIRTFDVNTQKSLENVNEFEITFSSEYIISEERKEQVIARLIDEIENDSYSDDIKEKIREDIEKISEHELGSNIYKYFNLFVGNEYTLFDYFENRVIYFDEITRCIERSKGIIDENNETIKIMMEKGQVHPNFAFKYMTFEEIETKYNNLLNVYLDRINKDRNLHAKRKEYSFSCREVNFFRSSMDVQIDEIKRYLNSENLVILVFSTLKKVETIKNALIDNNVKIKQVYSLDEIDSNNRDYAYILNGIISSGYVYNDFNLVVLAEDISGTNLQM